MIAGVLGLYAALYVMGFSQYLGGRKAANGVPLASRQELAGKLLG